MRTWLGTTILMSLAALMASATGCSDDGGAQGTKGNDCYPNGTCDEGLACLSGVCVDPTEEGNVADEELDLDACLSCGEASCADEDAACAEAEGCDKVLNCWLECGSDQECANDCSAPNFSVGDVQLVSDYVTCLATECTSDCVVDTTGGGGGGTGGGGNGTGGGGGGNTGGSQGSGESCSEAGETRGSCVERPLEACIDGEWVEEPCAGCDLVTPSTSCERVSAYALLNLAEPVAVENPNIDLTQTAAGVIADFYLEANQFGVLSYEFSSGVDPTRVELSGSLGQVGRVTVETADGTSGCQYDVDFEGRLDRLKEVGWNGCWGAWSSFDFTEPKLGTRLNLQTITSLKNDDFSITVTKVNI